MLSICLPCPIRLYERYGKALCTQHRIYFDILYQIVLKDIQKNAEITLKDEQAIIRALEKGDDEYIVFHREEIELDLPEEVKEFTKEMKVTDIGLWVDGENTIIVDYMINPEESDEILAVKFDSNLKVV